MSHTDRLHEIIDALPQPQIHPLLMLLESPRPLDNGEFGRLLSELPEEEVDDATVSRLPAAEAEAGDCITHDELQRRLGL